MYLFQFYIKSKQNYIKIAEFLCQDGKKFSKKSKLRNDFFSFLKFLEKNE